MSPQTLSYNIKQLAKKKLITVSPSELDARSKILKLTEAGKLVILWSKG